MAAPKTITQSSKHQESVKIIDNVSDSPDCVHNRDDGTKVIRG